MRFFLFKLRRLIEKESSKNRPDARWLERLYDLFTTIQAEMGKLILEGRLVADLTLEEARYFHALLSQEAKVYGQKSGERLSVTFEALPPEFAAETENVAKSHAYVLRRVKGHGKGIIPLQVVASRDIFRASYEFDAEALKLGGELKLQNLAPHEPVTAPPEGIFRVILVMFEALDIYAEQNDIRIESIYQQIATTFRRIRIEIRKEGDRPEADVDVGGTAVIIIPEKFIPVSDREKAALSLLRYIALSEWTGHLLHPEMADLTPDMKGIEPVALWSFIQQEGYLTAIKALHPYVAVSEFARRVFGALTAIRQENPALRELSSDDSKTRKALYADQARFLYSEAGRTYFESIWGNHLLEKIAEESMRWFSTPTGRRTRSSFTTSDRDSSFQTPVPALKSAA